jgi:hypothetical protein
MMEAANISETSVNLYQTPRRNTPEDSNLRCLFKLRQTFAMYTVRCIERMSDSISNMYGSIKVKVHVSAMCSVNSHVTSRVHL